jgi:hypothetical protein
MLTSEYSQIQDMIELLADIKQLLIENNDIHAKVYNVVMNKHSKEARFTQEMNKIQAKYLREDSFDE